MKAFRIFYLSTLALLSGSLSINAQSSSAGAFPAFSSLASELGTEATSLAGASLARSTGLYSDLLSSPVAMLESPDKLGFGFGYASLMPYFGPDRKMTVSAAFNNGLFAFGLNTAYSLSPSYPIYNEYGSPTGDFTPSGLRIIFGAGFKIVKGLSAGVDIKYLRTSEAEDFAMNGFAAGIHLGYTTRRLFAYLGIRNIGPSVKSEDGTSFPIPGVVAGSVSYSIIDATKSKMFIDATLYAYMNGGIGTSFGAEYSFDEHFFTRAGYLYASKGAPLASYASIGLGVRFFGVSMNATYLLASKTLGGTYLIGLSYSL